MGSYAYLRLGELTLASSKREPDPSVLAVFRESDRQELPFPEDYWDDDKQPPPTHTLLYVTSLGAVKDRLDLMGFTLAEVEEEFARGLAEKLDREEWQLPTGVPVRSHMVQALSEERAALQSLTFDQWLSAFQELAHGAYKDVDFVSEEDMEEQFKIPPLYRYMLRYPFDFQFGFPSADYRYFLRTVAEMRDSDLELVYDLTELIADDYVRPDERLADWAAHILADDYSVAQRVVILTEGSIDRWAISSALEILYPHLVEYFSFLDFEGMKVPGGAGFLAATVKAFAGAQISNRVVAVFDNDTAGHAAMRQLRDLSLPPNIRVLTYPNLSLASSYPSIGPTGLAVLDVNGLAGSIEMYFGRDVLSREDGSLVPVQWRGFDEGLSRYQGELLEKRRLHDAFRAKVRSTKDGTAVDADWSGMRAVLDAIRGAFNTSGHADKRGNDKGMA